MKDQYVGDVGDYTKLALLRVVEGAGFSLGMNWYLTPDDSGSKDGRHIGYLDSSCDTPDKDLYDGLHGIVKKKQSRNVKSLMDSGLLKTRLFHDDRLDFSAEDRWEIRYDWHKKALVSLREASVVFLDPDNGFIPDGVGPYSKYGNKYVTYEEVADYYNNGKSVIVYNHGDRSSKEKYINRLTRVTKLCSVPIDNLICIHAPRYSPRDYLFLMRSIDDFKKMKASLDKMLGTGWNRYLRYTELYDPC